MRVVAFSLVVLALLACADAHIGKGGSITITKSAPVAVNIVSAGKGVQVTKSVSTPAPASAPEPAPQPAAKAAPQPAPEPAPQPAPKPEEKKAPAPAPQPAPKPEEKKAPAPAPQPAPKPEEKTAPAPAAKQETKGKGVSVDVQVSAPSKIVSVTKSGRRLSFFGKGVSITVNKGKGAPAVVKAAPAPTVQKVVVVEKAAPVFTKTVSVGKGRRLSFFGKGASITVNKGKDAPAPAPTVQKVVVVEKAAPVFTKTVTVGKGRRLSFFGKGVSINVGKGKGASAPAPVAKAAPAATAQKVVVVEKAAPVFTKSVSIGKGRHLMGGKGGSISIVKTAPVVSVQKVVAVAPAPVVTKQVSGGKGKSFSLSFGKGL